MPKVLHTATGPNGEAFKRTSDTKRYAFVLIGRPSISAERARVVTCGVAAEKLFNANTRYAANGYEPSSWMIGKPARNPDFADLAVEFREKGRADAIAWLADKPATAAEHRANVEAAALAVIAEREASGAYNVFHALRWSRREDLALKGLGEFPMSEDFRAIPVAA